MSRDDVVRLTHSELNNLSRNYDVNNSASKPESLEDGGRKKRPPMQIYQPRSRRSAQAAGDRAVSSPPPSSPSEIRDSTTARSNAGDMSMQMDQMKIEEGAKEEKVSRRQKKPDLQRYIPRQRHQGQGASPTDVQNTEQRVKVSPDKELSSKNDAKSSRNYENVDSERSSRGRGSNRGRGRRGGRGLRESRNDKRSSGVISGDATSGSFEMETEAALEWDYQEVTQGNQESPVDLSRDSEISEDTTEPRSRLRSDSSKKANKDHMPTSSAKSLPSASKDQDRKSEEIAKTESHMGSSGEKMDINFDGNSLLGTLVITNSKYENQSSLQLKDSQKSVKDNRSQEGVRDHRNSQQRSNASSARHINDSHKKSNGSGQRSNPSRYSETKPRQRKRSGDLERSKAGHRVESEAAHKKDSKESTTAESGPGSGPIAGPGTGQRGILHLPPSQVPRDQVPHQPPPQMPHHLRGRSRGRARGSHRSLYDPNNPSKPMQVPAQSGGLRFHDSYEQQHSPDAFNTYQGDYQYSAIPGHVPGGNSYVDREYTVVGSPHSHDTHHPPDYSHPGLHHDEPGIVDDTYARDPHYHSESEQDIKNSSRSANHAKAEVLLRDVMPFDSQLNNLLSRRVNGLDGWKKVLATRRDVQNKYEQIVLLDPDLSNKQNVEQLLWRSAYYQVIEVLRRMLTEDEEEESGHKDMLLNLLEEGTSFYEHLLQSLQNVFGFTLDEFIDANQLPPENQSRSVKLALLSAQRCMICLGDIARYKEQTNHTSNYGKARSWYLKAQQIAPKNGRPYNQLAILALYTRRKLDAVYFYMRSLAASNPFLTARESLMALFDEARKKVEHTEKKRLAEQAAKLRMRKKKNHHGNGQRVVIWLSPDGRSSSDNVNDDDDDDVDDLSRLSDVELNKRFVLSFLNVQGKLFTKIGMETYAEVRWQALREFQQLLEHVPVPIGHLRLLQLVAINMFAIENTSPKDIPLEEGCRSLHQENAVCLGLDMFAHLCQRCAVLLREHMKSGDYQILSEDLRQLLPCVKVWSDWMTCHVDLWNPPPVNPQPEFRSDADIWEAVAHLCNVLKDVDTSYVKLYSQRKEGCDPVILGEDALLGGFVPLLGRPQSSTYVHATVDKEVAKDCLRVEKLCIFGDYLCGIEPPLLTYNVQTRLYESCVSKNYATSDPESRSPDEALSDEQEGDLTLPGVMTDDADAAEEDHIRELRQRKQQLQQQLQHQESQKKSIQAVLEGGSQGHRRLEIHVRPMLLVPDTNCFIDHLTSLETILQLAVYTIVVPLVVINELDGLAQGSREGQYATEQHAKMVRENAAAAINFLECKFSSKHSHLRALTSKGTVMETINFRSEDMTGKRGNNDDLILACCMHYIQDIAREFMPDGPDEPIKLHREVVLLTDDRNLRLKAHMRNVPVKTVPAFSSWVKIT